MRENIADSRKMRKFYLSKNTRLFTRKDIPASISQAVFLEAAIGLVWHGHCDKARFQSWKQVKIKEIVSTSQAKRLLQLRPGHFAMHMFQQVGDLSCDLYRDLSCGLAVLLPCSNFYIKSA